MKEAEAKKIAATFAADVGLSPRRGTVFVKASGDGRFEILISADPVWLSSHALPEAFRGLAVVRTDRIVGEAHKAHAHA
jgi:hypothetical protein